MTISVNDFNFLSSLIKEKSGIVLKEDKIYLLEARLLPLIKKMGLNGFDGLISKIKQTQDQKIIKSITDAMTTNETYFFRDNKPFEHLKNFVLPQVLADSKNGKIRILSLGCSTGQEAYSICMMLEEEKKNMKGKKFEVVGLDFSDPALDKARSGVYTQFEVQRGLPISLLVKYFNKDGESWKAKDDLRAMTSFHQHNAMEDFSKFGIFDIVLCRNIMIYFDIDTKTKVLDNIAKILHDKSVLIVGSSETIYGLSDKYKPMMHGTEVLRSIYNHFKIAS